LISPVPLGAALSKSLTFIDIPFVPPLKIRAYRGSKYSKLILIRTPYSQKQDSIIGHFLICYLAVLLFRILQIYILEDKYGTEEIFNFIRDFKVAKISDYRYINLTRSSEFIKKLAMNTKQAFICINLKKRHLRNEMPGNW